MREGDRDGESDREMEGVEKCSNSHILMYGILLLLKALVLL